MELYKEILANIFSGETIHITFPDLHIDASQIVEGECYKALQKIKAIIRDDSMDDNACFEKIEAIVCTLEETGSSGGFRHDFG